MEDTEGLPDSVLFPRGRIDPKGFVIYEDCHELVAVDPGRYTGFHYYPPQRRTTRRTPMTRTAEQAQRERELLVSALARNEREPQEAEAAERTVREKYGFDQWPEGTIVTFDYQFSYQPSFGRTAAGTRTYQYAILKTDAGWYSSGPRTPDAKTWEDMIKFWERGTVSNMEVVKGRKKFRPILPLHVQEVHGDYGVVS